MSGLEPLVVLGLACNILQIVGTGQKTIAFVSNVYKTGSFDDRIKEHAATLATLSPTIGGIHPPISVSRDEQQLLESANKCQTICQDIIGEIKKLEKGIAKKSKASTAALTMKVIGKKLTGNWKLDDLEEQLQEARDLIQLSLVDRTYSQVRTMYTDLSSLPHDLRSFVERWGEGKRELNDLISMEATIIKDHVTASVNQAQAAQEARVLEEKQAGRREKLLRSLNYNGMNERRNDHHVHHPSTLQTIWKDDLDTELWQPFRKWLPSYEQVFWVSGKPGSGKTTLMKFLVSEPDTQKRLRVWNPDVIVVSHFIWLLGPEPMQRNIKGVFCSVIHQILTARSTMADQILGASDAVSLKENPTDWSLEELQDAWAAMMRKDSIPVCLFLDGLDEIDPKDGTGALLDILKDNFQPFQHIKLCMASRPEPLLRTRLDQAKYPSLALHDVNHQDITRYVESALICKGRPKEVLKRILVEKAQGVFLWIHLVVRNVNRALELSQEFDEVLRYTYSLPEGLETLFESMWNRMSRDERHANSAKIALYFRLLILAPQLQIGRRVKFESSFPASMSVLQLALAVTPLRLEILKSRNLTECSKDASIECKKTMLDLMNQCAGFVDVTTPSGDIEARWARFQFAGKIVAFGEQRTRVAFVHRSAVDFLVDTSQGKSILDQNHTTSSRLQLNIWESRLASMLLENGPCFPRLFNDPEKDQYSLQSHQAVGPKVASIAILPVAYDMWRSEMHQDVENLVRACERLSNVPGDIPERATIKLLPLDFFSAAVRYGLVEYTHRAILDNRVPKSSMPSILASLLSSDTILVSPAATRLANFIIDAGVDVTERLYLSTPAKGFHPTEILTGPLECLLQSLFCLIRDFYDPEQVPPWFSPCLYGGFLDLIGTMIKAGTNVNGSVIFALRITQINFPTFRTNFSSKSPATWVEVPMKRIIRVAANCLLLDSHIKSPDTTRDVQDACMSLATLLEETDRFLEPELVDIIGSHYSEHIERDLVLEEGKQLARLARDILHLDTPGESETLRKVADDIIEQRLHSADGDNSKRLVWKENRIDEKAFWKAADDWKN